MLYLVLTDGALVSLIGLSVWERERVSDALVLLTLEPRPKPFSQKLSGTRGEALKVSIGERGARYKIYKGAGDDVGIIVFGVS